MPEQEQKPTVEYTALVTSPLVNGEAKLVIGEKGLTVSSLFDAIELPFAQINALILADYLVTVKADGGDYVFSKLGNWCQPFYDALLDAYNQAVLQALFVSGEPIVTANGNYQYTENGTGASGSAPVQVYENSVVILPPDLGARRLPLCFVQGLDKSDYQLTLQLNTDENYTLTKLGYDSDPFAAAVEKQIRALRDKSLAAVQEIDPTLSAAQAAQIAKLVPEGAAAAFGRLAAIAPSFVAALEAKLADTRAADGYAVFKELSDPAQIYAGFKKNELTGAGGSGTEGTGRLSHEPQWDKRPVPSVPLAAVGDALGAGNTEDAADEDTASTPDPYLLWLIAPSPDGQFAAVEFAEANSATFIYKTGGDFAIFAQQLNRALEAIDFKREVVRLTDEELLKPENANYYMAAKRTAALQFIRTNFAGRIIHSNPETWKKSLLEYFS
ncbi:hypothetical protein FACS1894104_5020 [Actinomycetota bacterium]|nr:hypothetical protein FACS1894104_5020 [Actinomycetota bacterium]